MIAPNEVVGNFTLAERALEEYFFRPTTVYDGCYNRRAAEGERDHWQIQSSIDTQETCILSNIRSLQANKETERTLIEQFDVLAEALTPPQIKPSWLGFVLSDAQYNLGITAEGQLNGAPSYLSIETDDSSW